MTLGCEISKAKRLAGLVIVQQFLRFALVGIVATAVHYGILIGLVQIWQVHLIVATSIGFAAGAFVSFTLNRRYTFKVDRQFARGIVGYFGALMSGLFINAVIVAVLTSWGLLYIAAQVFATGLVLIWNFLVARLVVFHGAG